MSFCMSRAAWEERTYIKTIGNCTLTCDRIIHMDGAEMLSPEEEAEAWDLFEEALSQLKTVLYLHALRNIHHIHVNTKTGKLVMFSFEDSYCDGYTAAHGGDIEQIENVEVLKEAAATAFAAAYLNKKKAAESDYVTKEE
ncbi:hypothetical protein BGZ93_008319 [Podila epicladia]|nr:hypothetical protein BGZ92_011366 [Podila epicladia]KAG0099280.1 hypothetical protein BGZ93_008319 [Podila epicladia]